jgi:colanic acid biosynthesis glycosyl transferase WcaI
MKILVYSANFAPEPTGIGKYSGEMAVWLARQGHEVRAVCAPPYYPKWEVDEAYRGNWFKREDYNGVDVWRAPLWVPRKPSGLTRVLHLLSFAVSSFPTMLRQIFWRPGLVIIVAPAMVCAPAALVVGRLSGAKVWLHLQDFEVDIAFNMKLLRGDWLHRVFLRMERWLLRRFDNVSSISGKMVDRLLQKGVSPNKVSFLPNWVDTGHIQPSKELAPQRYRTALAIAPGAIVVLFSGTLGGKQGLMLIPEAARLLKDRTDIVFVICGEGVMKAQLEAACSDLPNTRFMPLQPVERVGELLCTADIHVLPQSADAQDLVLPSKLSGMLASGRPVVATCRADTELSMVVSNCGIVVEPEDTQAFAAAVCQLADDAPLRHKLGRAARSNAETNYERDAILERFFGRLDQDQHVVADDAVA